MSNKVLPVARRALSVTLLMGGALAHGAAGATDAPETVATSETVDAFAQRQLAEQARSAASPGNGLELVFTQTEGKTRSAYLLVAGRYGKDVRRGDIVDGWTIRAIEHDFVEIGRNGRRERLLLAGAVRSHRETSTDGRERAE